MTTSFHHRANVRRGAGTTLIELVLAVGLSTLLVASLMAVIGMTSRVLEVVTPTENSLRHATAVRLLSDDLRYASQVTKPDSHSHRFERADPSSGVVQTVIYSQPPFANQPGWTRKVGSDAEIILDPEANSFSMPVDGVTGASDVGYSLRPTLIAMSEDYDSWTDDYKVPLPSGGIGSDWVFVVNLVRVAVGTPPTQIRVDFAEKDGDVVDGSGPWQTIVTTNAKDLGAGPSRMFVSMARYHRDKDTVRVRCRFEDASGNDQSATVVTACVVISDLGNAPVASIDFPSTFPKPPLVEEAGSLAWNQPTLQILGVRRGVFQYGSTGVIGYVPIANPKVFSLNPGIELMMAMRYGPTDGDTADRTMDRYQTNDAYFQVGLAFQPQS